MASVSLSRGLWDPYRVLDVDPNDPDCTCVGLAKSTKLRCQWPFDSRQFNAYQRATAVEILESMSKMDPSNITTAALYSLAQNTLCMDFHQWQADAKSRKWKAKIEDHLRPVKQLQYEPNDTKQPQNGFAKDGDARQQEINKTLERVTAVVAELKASQTLCSELTEKNDRLDRQREEEKAANSWDVARLRQQLTDFQTTAKALDERNAEVESLKRQLDGRNANFEKELKGLRASKARLETAIVLETGSLKKEVRDRERALDEKAQVSEKEAEGLRQELQESNARREASEAKSSRDLEHLGRKLEALSQRYTESGNENAAQMSRLRERDRSIGQLEERMGALKQGLAERDRRVEDLVKQMDVVNGELAEREVGASGTG